MSISLFLGRTAGDKFVTVTQLINQNWVIISLVAFGLGILFELGAIRFLKRTGNVPAKDSLLSIFLGLASDPVNAIFAFITTAALFAAAPFAVGEIPITWGSFLLCFVLDDLRFYVHHRICHRVRWGWAMHVVHHSSTNFNMPIALRQSWMKHFTGTMMLKIPLILIGFDPALVVFCGILNATYQFFLHTETIDRLPRWFEFIFNTPSHHRVHHGSDILYLDKNHAGILIIWDRMFGSFQPEIHVPKYGLTKNVNTFNPIKIAFHEWINIAKDFKKVRNLKDAWNYLFNAPGWSNDGSSKTTQQMRREIGLDNK